MALGKFTMTLANKITIVVPCKNERDYIHNLLNSLKKQKEIEGVRIIIADASTDNTREIINKNKGNLCVEVIQGGPVSIAKNNGAKLVKTPYILFIDADVIFFNSTTIYDAVQALETKNLDLVGLNIKCYDNDFRTIIGFKIFNVINNIMKYKVPFAVGAFMLTRKTIFDNLGGFPAKYSTSEDFFLSRMYNPKKFKILNHYFGQDSRRFKKMGYLGMTIYLIKNFINRNNETYWTNLDNRKYWE